MFMMWCVGSLATGVAVAALESKTAVDGDEFTLTGWFFVTLLWFLCAPFYVFSTVRRLRRLRGEQELLDLQPHLDEIETYLRPSKNTSKDLDSVFDRA